MTSSSRTRDLRLREVPEVMLEFDLEDLNRSLCFPGPELYLFEVLTKPTQWSPRE